MTDLTTTPKARAAQGDARRSPSRSPEAHQPAGGETRQDRPESDSWEQLVRDTEERLEEMGDRDPVEFKAWLDGYIDRACMQVR